MIGGWTLGTIFTFQTGAPFLLLGGTNTFNDYGDGGVTLNGVTVSQLQKSIGKYPIPGTNTVAFINPKYLSSSGGANSAYISAEHNPGHVRPTSVAARSARTPTTTSQSPNTSQSQRGSFQPAGEIAECL